MKPTYIDIRKLWIGESFRQRKGGSRIWTVIRQHGTGPGDAGHAEVIELQYAGPGAIGNPIGTIEWGHKVEHVTMVPSTL